MASQPPITREQAILETYFQCVSQFAYDKAKEYCDKERDLHRQTPSSVWTQFVAVLGQLALLEKTYMTLVFLGQKWFGRKDNLRSSYNQLQLEIKKIPELSGKKDTFGTSPSSEWSSIFDPHLEQLVKHLSGQLVEYVFAREKTIDFFEKMAAVSTSKNLLYNDLSMFMQEIINGNLKKFHHPILAPLKHGFNTECEVIHHLLQAQIEMESWHFLPSLLQLNDASGKLANWAGHLPVKEGRKMFGSKTPQSPVLYQWLLRFKGLLVSKFSLYFHEVLSKQAPQTDVKAAINKTTVDFYTKIATFHRKSDASYVCLVFDTTCLEGPIQAGYVHPDKVVETPTGLESYPAIFSYPAEKPKRYWPEVISILTDRCAALSNVDKHVYFCDEKMTTTYFLSRIEPRVTLVLIYEGKKPEKDSYINNFLVDITTQLRCSKLFNSLRLGTKS